MVKECDFVWKKWHFLKDLKYISLKNGGLLTQDYGMIDRMSTAEGHCQILRRHQCAYHTGDLCTYTQVRCLYLILSQRNKTLAEFFYKKIGHFKRECNFSLLILSNMRLGPDSIFLHLDFYN